MILNDIQIAELCFRDNPMISPFVSHKVSKELALVGMKSVISYGCSPFGYDIRLSKKDFRIFSLKLGYTFVDPKNPGEYFEHAHTPLNDPSPTTVLIPPHFYALGVSLEKFNIPNDIIGICLGKSTYARCGVIVNATPLEPNWRGHLTIEISNANSLPVIIYLEEGICQVLFFRGERPKQQYEGKYQDQKEEVKQATV